MAKTSDDPRDSAKKFDQDVFPAELESVAARWTTAYGTQHPRQLAEGSEPTVEHGLFGLAFSGGGIRSATINLGMVQALHRHGVFDHADYMSTVSGGGYFGSSLSTIMRDGEPFPYAQGDGEKESAYLTWLRNNSNYLATGGLLDYFRIFAILLRGILINLLVLVPLLLVVSLVLTVRYPPGGMLENWLGDFTWHSAYRLAPLALGFAVLMFLSYPAVIRVFKVLQSKVSATTGSESSVESRNAYERFFAWLLLLVAVAAAIETLPILLHWFHLAGEKAEGLRGIVAGVAGGASMIALSAIGKLMARFKGLQKKLIMWAVGLLGLVLPLLLILFVAEILIYEPQPVMVHADDWLVWALAALPVAMMVTGSLAALCAAILARLEEKRGDRFGAWTRRIWLTLATLAGLCITGLLWLVTFVAVENAGGIPAAWFVALLAFLIWLFVFLSVDINLTAMLGFYRDRLASAYLIGVDKDKVKNQALDEIDVESVRIEEDVDLEDICQTEKGSTAPYHLVNVTHNLQGSKQPDVRERNADFFFFSKKYVGGNRTGYCSSEQLEAVFPQMDLATAMGISAAAASPNMGKGTSAALVAVLTLFNIRLGYWIPNPGRLCKWVADQRAKKPDWDPLRQTIPRRMKWRIRPRFFLKEMLSWLDEKADWVNLSDGGHLENMAAYELLRRRCKYIIIGDGEADKALQFKGLAALKRYAFIDMGITIDIRLDDLRLGADGTSNQHCALGEIQYPGTDKLPPEKGLLLYVKSSFTGDEDELIRQYRAQSGDFPHESTADQFFSEGQFEAYRSLGYHIASGLFERSDPLDHGQFETWFGDLKSNLAPRLAAENLFLELQSDLGAIEDLLRKKGGQERLALELQCILAKEELAPYDPTKDEKQAALFVAAKQLRLMENVFMSLDLARPKNWSQPGNQGWMTQFRTWSASPLFQFAYKSLSRFHSQRFQEFCDRALGLG